MQPHQQRVVDEKTELDDKMVKLFAFVNTNPVFDSLPKDEQIRLKCQLNIMGFYSEILKARIAAFQ